MSHTRRISSGRNGNLFYFLRPTFLPEDLLYMNTILSVVQTNIPNLPAWLQKVFWVMGSYIFTTGLLTIYIANIFSHMNKGSIYYGIHCRNYLHWFYDNDKFYSSIRFQKGVAGVCTSVNTFSPPISPSKLKY